MNQAKQLLIASQLTLLSTILVCMIISPDIPFSLPQGGLSNFGTERPTILVFSVGFWASITLLSLSVRKLKSSQLKNILIGSAVLLGLLVLSTYPYKLNQFFENLHIFVGFTVAIYQFIAAFLLARQSVLNIGLKIALIFFLISTLSAISTIFATGLLFMSQLTGGVGFALVLIYSENRQSTKEVIDVS